MPTSICLFCGGEDGPRHLEFCDGRQGRIEAFTSLDGVPLEPPHARTTDPWTSHAAAAQAHIRPVYDGILASLQAEGGGTTEELTSRTGLSLVSISPSMKPMEKLGLVRRSGTYRQNRSGRWAIVWEAT